MEIEFPVTETNGPATPPLAHAPLRSRTVWIEGAVVIVHAVEYCELEPQPSGRIGARMVCVLGNLLTRGRSPDEVAAGERQCACGDEPIAIRKQQEARFGRRHNSGDRREGRGEERHQEGSDGDSGRRDGTVLDDLFGNGVQRRLSGFRLGIVAAVAVVHDQVVEHHNRIVVGNVDFETQPNGMGPVVHISHRFFDEHDGVRPDIRAEVDEIGVVVQRSRVRDPETIHGEGREPGRRRRVQRVYLKHAGNRHMNACKGSLAHVFGFDRHSHLPGLPAF